MRPAAVAVLVVLTACGQEQAPAPVASAPARTPPAAAATAATAARATAPAGRPIAPRRAVLDSGGISIGQGPGTADRFAFGAPRAAVEAAAERWLGQGQPSANAECGAGPMEFSRHGGLTLNYLDGKFAGWSAESGTEAVTSDGIRAGVRMRDLHVTRSVRPVPGSTLDGEFAYLAADGTMIGGFASGTGRDAVARSLYAGVNCFFR